MYDIIGRHVAKGLVIAAVVVVHEAGDSHLQITRDFIRDLVHFLLDTLVVALQLPVGLWMVRRCPDATDPYQAQVVAKSPGDVARSVVAQQSARSSKGTSVIPVLSTANWTTWIKESAVMSTCSFQARMDRE